MTNSDNLGKRQWTQPGLWNVLTPASRGVGSVLSAPHGRPGIPTHTDSSVQMSRPPASASHLNRGGTQMFVQGLNAPHGAPSASSFQCASLTTLTPTDPARIASTRDRCPSQLLTTVPAHEGPCLASLSPHGLRLPRDGREATLGLAGTSQSPGDGCAADPSHLLRCFATRAGKRFL